MKVLTFEYVLLVLLSAGMIQSCRQQARIAESEVPAMDLATVSDTIEIVLDSAKNNYQVVPLETHPAALIGDGAKYIYVSNDHILVETGKGLQQFNRKGRYIRQIMGKGKGPNEFLQLNPALIHHDGLYFIDFSKSRTQVYRCNLLTGDVTGFPLALNGRVHDFCMINDSVIMIISDETGENGRTCRMFVQNFKGHVVDRQELGTLDIRSVTGPAHVRPGGTGSVLFSNPKCDTVFRYSDHRSSPVWTAKNLSDFIPGKEYEKFLKPGFQYYARDTLFLNKTSISQVGKTIKYNDREWVAVVTGSSRASIVRSFHIKDLDWAIDTEEIQLLNKTTAIVEYSAIDFKEKIRTILGHGNMNPENWEKLSKLDQSIRENDNPILILWKL